jgi:hypothetical protein
MLNDIYPSNALNLLFPYARAAGKKGGKKKKKNHSSRDLKFVNHLVSLFKMS